MKRKDFIKAGVIGSAGLSIPLGSYGNPFHQEYSNKALSGNIPKDKIKICVFSKQLQWLNYQDMAFAVADMGYDGIDLTVRAGGHVLPERVASDLPKAVEAANKAGIKILMISTDINDANEAKTENILKTAASLNISNYRTNGINYQKDLTIPANLELIKRNFYGLAELNKKYELHSDYLNHSGDNFGASLWDLWYTLKDLDLKYIGSQFDIKHATIDGPFSWPNTLKLLHNYVHTFVVRDFAWENNNGVWQIKPVPIGEGRVDFKKFFGLVKQYQLHGPISLMCDYELGGAENGTRSLTVSKNIVLNAMKKDLLALKSNLKTFDL